MFHSRVLVLTKTHLTITALVLALGIALIVFVTGDDEAATASGINGKERTIHMVTGEFKTKTADGKEIEAYRWDPGTIFVEKDEKIKLVIYGVNGESHPFVIEGMNIQGEVKKGKETIVQFQANHEGSYRIICLTHPDKDHQGPMIGYIVVD